MQSDAIAPDLVIADHTIAPGAYWTAVLARWTTLRVTDLEGRGSAALLAYNAHHPSERYNAPDTTKVQNMIFLTEGWVLLSDLGRVLMSITADTSGGHETLCGATTSATVIERHGGGGTYLARRNERFTNARDNFLAALGRHGLDERDLVPNLNLFSRVEVDVGGDLRWTPGASRPGAWVDLRAEQDLLVAISATPHVLDPSPSFGPGPIGVTVWRSPAPSADDRCRTASAEIIRAFENTDQVWAQQAALGGAA
jgi:hypothetical protein